MSNGLLMPSPSLAASALQKADEIFEQDQENVAALGVVSVEKPKKFIGPYGCVHPFHRFRPTSLTEL